MIKFVIIKLRKMKNLILTILLSVSLLALSCSKNDKTSERFKLLTAHEWASDSLLVNGLDASQPGGLLVNLKGTAKFNEDGTGAFGVNSGTWRFNSDETELTITSTALPIPMVTDIAELNALSLKITTSFPNASDLSNPYNIRMTFKAK